MTLLGLYRRGVRNALELHLTTLELSWPSLPPAFDGYRVLHISDTHLAALPALSEALALLLNGLEVDLVVLTGDFCVGWTAPSTGYWSRSLMPWAP
ncbi:MAG: metallophosphoesterase [Alphaproteobacteria bacterium]